MKRILDCREEAERLTECTRQGSEPGTELAGHMESCETCSERWAAERKLHAGLTAMRSRAVSLRTPESVREALMVEFAETRRRPVTRRPAARWVWGLAAAAMVVVSALTARQVALRLEPAAIPVVEAPSEAQQEGFIEVPFAPPLAPGELIRVVHTQLEPAALASLGVNVDSSWTAELPADLLVGQDGFPRAVRVSDEYSGSSDF